MPEFRDRWRFHWPHVRAIPMHVFKGGRWWVSLTGYVAFVIAVVIALNQQIGKLALSTWTGISPFWALVPMGIAVLLGWSEGYYQQVKRLKGELATATTAPQPLARRSLAQLKREGLELHRAYFEELGRRAEQAPQLVSARDSAVSKVFKYNSKTQTIAQQYSPKVISIWRDLAAYGYHDANLDENMQNAAFRLGVEAWISQDIRSLAALCDQIPD